MPAGCGDIAVGIAEVLPRFPDYEFEVFPVIKTGPLYGPISYGKAEWLDQMQGGADTDAEPADIPRVRGNLRAEKDDLEHVELLNTR